MYDTDVRRELTGQFKFGLVKPSISIFAVIVHSAYAKVFIDGRWYTKEKTRSHCKHDERNEKNAKTEFHGRTDSVPITMYRTGEGKYPV